MAAVHKGFGFFFLSAALIGLALFWGFYKPGGYLMNDDEGAYFCGAWRVSLREVPYRDFFVSQTPLSFYLGAALFKVFGSSASAQKQNLFWSKKERPPII